MTAYRIKFMKIFDHSQPEAIYRTVIIRLAHDSIRAVAAAKRRFERRERVSNWRERADRLTIEPLTYPDTSEFHMAPAEQQWRSFVKSRMSIMKKNLDPME